MKMRAGYRGTDHGIDAEMDAAAQPYDLTVGLLGSLLDVAVMALDDENAGKRARVKDMIATVLALAHRRDDVRRTAPRR